MLPYKQPLFRETKKKCKRASTLPVNHSHMRLNLHPGRLMRKQQSHWLVLSSYRPCFDFSKSVRANADNVIHIHESSSLFVLSAFYVVLSIIHSMIINLSVLLIDFPAVFYWKWKWHDIQPSMVTRAGRYGWKLYHDISVSYRSISIIIDIFYDPFKIRTRRKIYYI